ncbi:hypothetical protein QQ045_002864 [Rhodiola kirilowii]
MSRIEKIPVPLHEAIGAKQQESSCSSVAGVPQVRSLRQNIVVNRRLLTAFTCVDLDVVGTWRRKVVDAGALCSGRAFTAKKSAKPLSSLCTKETDHPGLRRRRSRHSSNHESHQSSIPKPVEITLYTSMESITKHALLIFNSSAALRPRSKAVIHASTATYVIFEAWPNMSVHKLQQTLTKRSSSVHIPALLVVPKQISIPPTKPKRDYEDSKVIIIQRQGARP